MRTIICAAGLGSRLKLNRPKCLLDIGGKSLIQRQIESLREVVEEIKVVTGFKHDLVAEHLDGLGVGAVFNGDFETTGVADSVRLGIGDYSGEILVIDGDVLFTHKDITRVASAAGEVLCITKNISFDKPVFARTKKDQVTSFSRRKSKYEWAGICKVHSDLFKESGAYIFEILSHRLPMRYIEIDSIEIDTPSDIVEAMKWIDRNG